MSERKYWLTTHWPPRQGARPNPNGIWLADGHQSVGTELRSMDHVIIYESRTGRDEIQSLTDVDQKIIRSVLGHEGVIAICEVTRELFADGVEEETKYRDGSKIWWKWYAPTKTITTSGFVSRARLNQILGFKPDYLFRGAGEMHSGLKRLTAPEFDAIVNAFREGEKTAERGTRSGHPGVDAAGESNAHRILKEYVASDPAGVLDENGLETQAVEFEFPSHDRADIYLHDRFGRVIGVEVEVDVGPNDIVGPLQALKYRTMLEFLANRKANEGRAFLIAYSIDAAIAKKCNEYGIECFEFTREEVIGWEKGKKL